MRSAGAGIAAVKLSENKGGNDIPAIVGLSVATAQVLGLQTSPRA